MLKLITLHFANKFLTIWSVFFTSCKSSDWMADLRHKELSIKLARKGVIIGKGSVVYDSVFSSSAKGDSFYIGDNTTITGTTLLAHDASPAVFLKELTKKDKPWRPGARRSYRNPISIGNNVFVGYGSIILPGVHIGNDVIVAAGSVVTKSVADGVVVAGNPARVISSIEAYKVKYTSILHANPDKF